MAGGGERESVVCSGVFLTFYLLLLAENSANHVLHVAALKQAVDITRVTVRSISALWPSMEGRKNKKAKKPRL